MQAYVEEVRRENKTSADRPDFVALLIFLFNLNIGLIFPIFTSSLQRPQIVAVGISSSTDSSVMWGSLIE